MNARLGFFQWAGKGRLEKSQGPSLSPQDFGDPSPIPGGEVRVHGEAEDPPGTVLADGKVSLPVAQARRRPSEGGGASGSRSPWGFRPPSASP